MAVSILVHETYPAAVPDIEIHQYQVRCVNSVSQIKVGFSLAKTGFREITNLHGQHHTSVLTS